MNPSTLSDACAQVLNHALDALVDNGITPERSFVSVGDPPADCHLIAVTATPQVKQPTGATQPRQRCSILHEAQIVVHYWQCVPTDEKVIPSSADLDAAGQQFHRALWVVWKRIAELIGDGDLIDGITCQNASLVDADTIEPQGGFGGWQITLNTDLTNLLATAS